MAEKPDKDEKPSGSISETEVEDPSQEESSSQKSSSAADGVVSVENLEVEAAPGAVDYSHPLLKDKSPEEVDRVVATLEAATREQNEELNRQHARLQAATSAPPPTETVEDPEKAYGDDFLGERFQTFEKRLDAKLEAMVAPLRVDSKRSESVSVRERMSKKYRHWDTLQPHIDGLLRKQDVDPAMATEAQLDMLYHTAVGLAHESGIDLGAGISAPAPTGTEEPAPVNIPQHRPSASPLPEDPPATKVRELTENERILAKTYFPTSKDPEGDYRTLQDAEIDEIVEPGFSKEGWK